jgi:hypothetical protein
MALGCGAIALAWSAASAWAGDDPAEDWTIQIVPRTTFVDQGMLLAQNDEGPIITPLQKPHSVPAPPQPGATEGETPATQPGPISFDASLYESIYNSIPFSRAEYVANPGYRHQAAMSIILGQPYAVTPVNYTPQVLDEFPVKWRPGRTVFGYRPLFLRSYLWGYGRPYGWAY